MRLLLITGSFPPMRCGVGDYTRQLAVALARRPELDVAVLTSRAAAASTEATFDLFAVMESWDLNELSKVKEIARAWAPDLVHIQYPTLGYGEKPLPWLLPMYLYWTGKPVVQTWHEVYTPKYLFRSGLIFRFITKALTPGPLVVVRENFRANTSYLLRWAFLSKPIRFIPNATAVPSIELVPSEREAIRLHYARPNCRVIAFFGFIYRRKRPELLFQIADPSDSHIVIIGDGFRDEDLKNYTPSVKERTSTYFQSIKQLAESEPWAGKVTMSGFLPDEAAARVLAAADAIVLPFLGGGGWNTSLHAAQAQGTFVLTTSPIRHGYDPAVNTYYAREHDIEEMRQALKLYAGRRIASPAANTDAWTSIAESHIDLYRSQVHRGHFGAAQAERGP